MPGNVVVLTETVAGDGVMGERGGPAVVRGVVGLPWVLPVVLLLVALGLLVFAPEERLPAPLLLLVVIEHFTVDVPDGGFYEYSWKSIEGLKER